MAAQSQIPAPSQIYDTFGRWLYVLPTPSVLASAPTTTTVGVLGQTVVVPSTSSMYALVSSSSAGYNWQLLEGAGQVGNFTSLTVTAGPTNLTGAFTTAGGAASINDNSNFGTTIGTGSSTGVITIGNAANTTSLGLNAVGNVSLTSAGTAATSVTIAAVTGAGGVTVNVGTGGLHLANQATATTIDLGNVIPTVGRTTIINGGLIASAVADVLSLGNGGVNFAGSTRTINAGSGPVTIGTNTVNIGTGAVATAGINDINLGTGVISGAGQTNIDIGAAGSLTTIAGSLLFNNAGLIAMQAHNEAGTYGGGNLTVTNNTDVGSTTASGFTTAAFTAAPFVSSTWTITNNTVLTTSKILAVASQSAADGSLMTVTSVVPAAGSFVVTLSNLGASAVTNTTVLTLSWIVTNV